MELIDVVRKLIGPVNPIGETNADDIRFANLKVMGTLVDRLVFGIAEVASNKDRAEFSMKRAGEYANKLMDDLGID